MNLLQKANKAASNNQKNEDEDQDKAKAATSSLKGHTPLGQTEEEPEQPITKSIEKKETSSENPFTKQSGATRKIQADAPLCYSKYISNYVHQANQNDEEGNRITIKEVLMEALELHWENHQNKKENINE